VFAPGANTFTLGGTALSITKPVTIQGNAQQPGAANATTIDGAAKSTVFSIGATGVTIDGVVIQNGANAKGNGGGIVVKSGAVLTLSRSTVRNNTASCSNCSGAGIEVDGTATVNASTISGNSAGGKGGGIYNASAATITNSTLDGNSANGGGGIGAAATTNINSTTIVNNTSNNSNGGGLYRNGGTFNVQSSILASNNAAGNMGRDCYGSPNFIGANMVQYTPGCNPTGATLLVQDPLLGPLTDNGGPTLTHQPNLTSSASTTSRAIDLYAPTSGQCTGLTSDQRGATFTRPQTILNAATPCDVGSVEIQPLSLNVALSASPQQVVAGARTVPDTGIGASGVIPTPSTQSSRYNTVRYNGARYNTVQLVNSRYNTVEFNSSRYNTVRYNTVRYNTVRYNTVLLQAESQLVGVGLPDPLQSVHLTDVQLLLPGGWSAFLKALPDNADTATFKTLALEQITLAQVLPYIGDVPMGDINLFGPLGSLPFFAFMTADDPLKDIPIAGQTTAADTETRKLDQWCADLASGTTDPCAALGVDRTANPQPSTITMLTVALAGFSLDNVLPVNLLVKDIAPNEQRWFSDMPLNLFLSSSLGDLTFSQLPSTWYTCGASCASAQLSTNPSAINPAITLYDVFTNPSLVVGDPGSLYSLADLAQVMMNTEDVWGTIDLTNSEFQNLATDDPAPSTVHYSMAVSLGGGKSAVTTVQLQLPAGFQLVTNTFKVDGGTPFADPAVDASNNVTLQLGNLTTGSHTVTIDARAGLVLGFQTASTTGCANVGSTCSANPTAGVNTALAGTSSATVKVVESFENAANPNCSSGGGDLGLCDTTDIAPNTIVISHISSASDKDVYHFVVPANGRTTASIILSNVPKGADYDLGLYGPRPQAIGAEPPTQTLAPVDDTAISLYPNNSHVAPDLAGDNALVAPLPQHGEAQPGMTRISAQRSNTDEEIDTGTLVPGGNYYIEVAGYNGSWSTQPYALRMSLDTTTPPPCAPVVRNYADAGPLPDSSTPTNADGSTPSPHVLIIVPQHHLYQSYGSSVDQLTDGGSKSVQALAQQVGATILAIDNPNSPADAPTVAAYNNWDQNHCDPNAANQVVHAIAQQIDAARHANPQIDSVVLVGTDSVLPMARIYDGTQIANENTFGGELQTLTQGQNGAALSDNELSSSLTAGYFLSDNAYGTAAGTSVNDHELFVPDVAVGRLVETPDDIGHTISTYLTNHGYLDPSTFNSALVTGYDFMSDTADAVTSALQANGKSVTELNGSWSGQQLTNALLPAKDPQGNSTSPGITFLNGHFDATRTLAGNGTDTVSTSSLAAGSGNEGDLSRRLLASMGCHSGLSVPDVSIGSEFDWPQAVTGQTQGGTLVGNTGYGIGDDTSLALSERLMTLYAQALNGSVTVGQALMLAKQEYLATTEVLNPYDEKVVQESTFYGLPFFQLATAVTTSNASVHALLMSAGGQSSFTQIPPLPSPNPPTDPRSGAVIAPLSVQIDAHHGLNRHDTPQGSYYDVNGDSIQVQDRPIEPRTTFDATQTGYTAHGVLVTSLTSSSQHGFHARYFRPIVDNGHGEHLLAPVGDAVFPSTLARVTHSMAQNGSRDLVLLTAGQAQDPQTDGTVTQVLFNNVGALVEYNADKTHFTPPSLLQSTGEIVGNTAGFTVHSDSTAARVFVLYKTLGVDGAWHGVDLNPTLLGDGSKQWWGGGPITGDAAEFFVEAIDSYGNVAYSNNKVSNFDAVRVPHSSNLTISLQPAAGVTQSNGWYDGPVTATISGGSNVTYSLDAVGPNNYSSSIPISGDGVHHLLAQDPSGDFTSVDVSIDGHAPPTLAANANLVANNVTAYDNGSGVFYNGPIALHVTANDSVTGSGIASISYNSGGPDTVITDGSNPALMRSPDGSASTDIPINASGTYNYKATDVAGNTATGSYVAHIDTTAPTPNCTIPPTNVAYNANQTITCQPTDNGGVGVDPATVTSHSTNVAPGTQTNSATIAAFQVCDLLGNCATVPSHTYTVDQQNPTVSASIDPGTSASAQDANHLPWYSGPVTVNITGSDGSGGSGVQSVSYSAAGALTIALQTIAGNLASVVVNPAADGKTTVSYSALDNANNSSGAPQNIVAAIDRTPPAVPCSGGSNTTQWFATDQSVTCTPSDAGVGIGNGYPSTQFSLSTSTPAGTQNASASTGPATTVCDSLQHCTSVGPFTFKVDKLGPTVTIASPVDGSTLTPGQNVTVSYSCNDGGGSGVASCVGTQQPGATLDTTPGTHVFTVTGTDAVGNVTRRQVSYNVGYNICYQYNTTTPQSRGGTVVLKVQLCDANGNNLSSNGITLTAIAEDVLNPPQLPNPNNSPGNSQPGFSFRFTQNQYQYNLDPTAPLPPPSGMPLGSGPHVLYFTIQGQPGVFQAPFVLK
jgi:hypothetical protein